MKTRAFRRQLNCSLCAGAAGDSLAGFSLYVKRNRQITRAFLKLDEESERLRGERSKIASCRGEILEMQFANQES